MYLHVGSQRRAERTKHSIRSLFLRHLPSTHCEYIHEMARESLFHMLFDLSLIQFGVPVACTVSSRTVSGQSKNGLTNNHKNPLLPRLPSPRH